MSEARRLYEDFEPGEVFESPGRTVTEADIVLFAGLSGDYNVLHTDAEFMRSSPFGERIAHGLLGLAIQQGLAGRALPIAEGTALAGLRWKFRAPIRIGDTIRVSVRVAEKKEGPEPGCGIITFERRVLNQRGEVVQEGETQHRVALRHA